MGSIDPEPYHGVLWSPTAAKKKGRPLLDPTSWVGATKLLTMVEILGNSWEIHQRFMGDSSEIHWRFMKFCSALKSLISYCSYLFTSVHRGCVGFVSCDQASLVVSFAPFVRWSSPCRFLGMAWFNAHTFESVSTNMVVSQQDRTPKNGRFITIID